MRERGTKISAFNRLWLHTDAMVSGVTVSAVGRYYVNYPAERSSSPKPAAAPHDQPHKADNNSTIVNLPKSGKEKAKKPGYKRITHLTNTSAGSIREGGRDCSEKQNTESRSQNSEGDKAATRSICSSFILDSDFWLLTPALRATHQQSLRGRCEAPAARAGAVRPVRAGAVFQAAPRPLSQAEDSVRPSLC